MFKKKDQLFDCLKLETFQSFFDSKTLLNLGVCCKKYYLLISPILTVQELDTTKKSNNKNNKAQQKKNKNKGKQGIKQQNKQSVVEVDVNRTVINKSKAELNDGNWVKINELPYKNQYLQDKLASGSVFFYKNQKTNKILFINRSLVDPNLNYNRGGFNSDMQDEKKVQLYSEMFEGDISDIDFTSPEALRARHRQLLETIDKKKQENLKLQKINYEEQFVKGINAKKISIILCFGGSFSFGIFQDGKCILHKSDKKYVCRKKAGERQLNKDKQSGTQIQSMGSQIRRDQQKKHIANVGQILTQNKAAIQSCDLVFLQAPGLNRLFIINDSETLSGVKDRLRSVCLTAKKANYSEVETIYSEIMKVGFVGPREQRKGQENQK